MQRRSCRVKRWRRSGRRSAALRRRGDPLSPPQWLLCVRRRPRVQVGGPPRGGAVQSVPAMLPTPRCPAQSVPTLARTGRDRCRPPSSGRRGALIFRATWPGPCDTHPVPADHRRPGRHAGRGRCPAPNPRPVPVAGWLPASAPSPHWIWPDRAEKRMRSRRWRQSAARQATGMPAEACGRACRLPP